jgi:hypothetical protein
MKSFKEIACNLMFIQGVLLMAFVISNGGVITTKLCLLMLAGIAFVSLSMVSKNHFNDKGATTHNFIAPIKHNTTE